MEETEPHLSLKGWGFIFAIKKGDGRVAKIINFPGKAAGSITRIENALKELLEKVDPEYGECVRQAVEDVKKTASKKMPGVNLVLEDVSSENASRIEAEFHRLLSDYAAIVNDLINEIVDLKMKLCNEVLEPDR
ncbi:MAG: hypothetical protein K9L59_10150 [Desulfobacterales bacterium]|nr:hypothetical protein [Desulfobacterales bacterium]